MNAIDIEEARIRATDAISKLAEKERLGDLMIVDAAIVETEEAWYFPYDAVAFVVHGDISAALAGNVPVKVPRDGSALTYEAPSQP
ncbi:YrhB domain-containing protein [Mycobacterium canetti]|uniref:YrhB domain-containing protein n=1 Tax=Mycobacterium canetti TaxID=78331 RepID=A0ABV1MGM5_9MYCO|nr:YrhB domain-containing protein [Mycobacterium canetti]MBA2784634.1 hypothetical protein [Mycobacterium canetti]